MAFELLLCYSILCSKYWCIIPIGNHACSEASKLVKDCVWPHKLSWSHPIYVCWIYSAHKSWYANYQMYIPNLNNIELNIQCLIKYRIYHVPVSQFLMLLSW